MTLLFHIAFITISLKFTFSFLPNRIINDNSPNLYSLPIYLQENEYLNAGEGLFYTYEQLFNSGNNKPTDKKIFKRLIPSLLILDNR